MAVVTHLAVHLLGRDRIGTGRVPTVHGTGRVQRVGDHRVIFVEFASHYLQVLLSRSDVFVHFLLLLALSLLGSPGSGGISSLIGLSSGFAIHHGGSS